MMELRSALDKAAAAGLCPEVIVVGVEGGNSLGGSFYINSPVTGQWMDWVYKEAVAIVDGRYRTIAMAEGRLLAGFSMGGFGAWNIAIQHPDAPQQLPKPWPMAAFLLKSRPGNLDTASARSCWKKDWCRS